MDEEQLRSLNSAIEKAHALGYRPLRSTVTLLHLAIARETVERVLADLRLGEDKMRVSGEILVVGSELVARATLDHCVSANVARDKEGAVSFTTVPRSSLKSVRVVTPERPLNDQWGQPLEYGLSYDSTIELEYESFDLPLRYPLNRLSEDQKVAVIADFLGDLRKS